MNRSWAVAATAAAVVTGLVACAPPDRPSGGATDDRLGSWAGAPSNPPHPQRFDAFVLHDGDTAHGTGEVVSIPGHPVRFCAQVPVAATGTAGGRWGGIKSCPIGVDTTGVDLHRLGDPLRQGRRIEGLAELTGVYRHGTLGVTHQRIPARSAGYGPDQPPCPTPPGGWPKAPPGGNIELRPAQHYAHTHPGTVFQLALLRPSRHRVLAYVLTVGDPEPVAAALRPAFGTGLCVARSEFTHHQIHVARSVLMGRSAGNSVTSVFAVGDGLTRQGQPVVDMSVPEMSPSLARALDAQPSGLVHADVWLRPVR